MSPRGQSGTCPLSWPMRTTLSIKIALIYDRQHFVVDFRQLLSSPKLPLAQLGL